MKTVTIARGTLDQMVAQAEREFPFECCGFVIGDDAVEEVRPIINTQNDRHSEDPARFSRDGRTAFLMDPQGLLAVLNEIDRRKLGVKIIYHSHPDHDAYFSATDRAQACSFDPSEPDYPDIAYIVMSVQEGKFARAVVFVWDAERKYFAETQLMIS